MKAFIIALVVATATTGNVQTIKGTVTTANENGVGIATEDGNGWWLEDNTFELSEGQKVVIDFDTKGTTSLDDDEILKIIK